MCGRIIWTSLEMPHAIEQPRRRRAMFNGLPSHQTGRIAKDDDDPPIARGGGSFERVDHLSPRCATWHKRCGWRDEALRPSPTQCPRVPLARPVAVSATGRDRRLQRHRQGGLVTEFNRPQGASNGDHVRRVVNLFVP